MDKIQDAVGPSIPIVHLDVDGIVFNTPDGAHTKLHLSDLVKANAEDGSYVNELLLYSLHLQQAEVLNLHRRALEAAASVNVDDRIRATVTEFVPRVLGILRLAGFDIPENAMDLVAAAMRPPKIEKSSMGVDEEEE